ncbi:MAG TPA: cache domain-containing protein, partial [Azospirillaceae bacterium]|nr:cache domain-containing protein [Azospirillaceae bacterium]
MGVIGSVRLAARVSLINVATLLILAASLVGFVITMLNDHLLAQAHSRLDENVAALREVVQSRGQAYRLADDALWIGDHRLDGDNATVDRFVGAVGGVATIFHGDTRVATNIVNEGKRAVGTKLAAGAARTAVVDQGKSYRGENVILGKTYLTAYDPIRDAAGGMVGILFVGVEKARFMALAAELQDQIILIAAGVTAFFGLLVYLVMSATFRPLTALRNIMLEISQGRGDQALPCLHRRDELGEMARTVSTFRDNLRRVEQLRVQQEEHERKAIDERKRAMLTMADAMEKRVKGLVVAIGRQIDQLHRSAGVMSANAQQTSAQSATVASASRQTSSNVQTVAAAADQLNASSLEIGRQVERSTSMAHAAAERAHGADGVVQGLAGAA